MGLPASSEAQLATTATPYMGWNTYYGVGGVFNESTIESVANSLITTGLQNAGYRIVWLDFGWATGARDAEGNLIVSSSQWPDGMSGLTSWLHSMGFLAGIYTDAGTSGCSGEGVGSYGHYQQDVNQFAAWGFDAIKVDFCGAGQQWLDQPPYDPQTLYQEFSSAVANNSSGRPMILNVDNFWTPGQINGTAPSFADSSWDNYSWAPADAQSWRTDTDIGSTGSIQFVNVLRNLSHDTGTASNASQPGIQNAAGPPGSTPPGLSPVTWGHWNDPDYLGPGLGMTDAQAQSQFSMWAMVAAPLILGSDPRSLSSASISMLENPQVIAIDQDSLGIQGYLLSGEGTTAQVWVKPLANGDRAVALFNSGSSSQQITTSASAIGMPSADQYTLLDVWANQTSTTSGTITATVPADTAVLYRVSAAGGGSSSPPGVGGGGGGSSSAPGVGGGGGGSSSAPGVGGGVAGISSLLGVPQLSQLRVSPRSVSVAGRKVGGRCVKPTDGNRNDRYCRRQGQFKVSFMLNEAASIELTIKRQAPGRKVKRRCVKPTKNNRQHASCLRWLAMPGNTKLAASVGANTFTIPGKIGGQVLGPATYELTATPTIGGLTGTAQTVTLKVVG